MDLLISTRNAHKLEEIRAIFDLPGVSLCSLDDFPEAPEVEEDGDTFDANAAKKALELARFTGLPAIADDSGLEVDALGGAPGVHSARYGGEPVDYARNNAKLLAELAGHADRRARFRCTMAFALPDGSVETVDGRCEGVIVDAPRGDHGFGYDPLFVPEGYEETFAEMASETKNRISHRARALEAALSAWGARWQAMGKGGARNE